jgi:soluble lytic murein transglycosylase
VTNEWPGGESLNRSARGRSRRSRRRGLIRLAALAAVIVAIVVAVVLISTGQTVVPLVSEQIYPIHYRDGIARVAERYDLDPHLLAAVVNAESGYDPQAVSPAGAVGLMQLMPDTAEWLTGLDSWQGGESPELTDPDDNLALGACYLDYLIDTLGGGIRPALAAYNAGQGVVGGWIEAAGGEDSFDLADIVYEETRTFVERVERYWELYSRIYPDVFAGTGSST